MSETVQFVGKVSDEDQGVGTTWKDDFVKYIVLIGKANQARREAEKFLEEHIDLQAIVSLVLQQQPVE